MHQVAYNGGERVPRRSHYREDDRDWYPPDDVWPYSMPHQSRIHEVQRADDQAPRGYGRAPRNSRSLDAFHNDMPPPHLSRGWTDPYRRPRRDILVYQDEEDEPPDNWQQPRTRETTPEYDRPPRRARRERRERRRPQPPPESSSESPPSTTESEDETSESENEIEVLEFRDAQHKSSRRQRRLRSRHRQHSRDDDRRQQSRDNRRRQQSRDDSRRHHRSRDDYLDSPDSRTRRRRSRRRRVSTPSDDDEIEVEYAQSRPEIVEPPVTPSRQIISRRQDSESPKYDHQSRVTSIIDSSRPPVASRRLVPGEHILQAPSSDQRTRTIKIYDAQGAIYREGRPRRSASAHTTREPSVSSSRHPPSLMGSNFADSSRMSSPVRPAKLRDCTACLSEVPAPRCPKLECGHRKCHTCLQKNFEQSMNDPQLMPPTCCDIPVQLHLVDGLFDASFKRKWNLKFVEHATQNRIFCPSPRCGEWIKPTSIHRDRVSGRTMGQCDRCHERVCVSCRNKWHYPRRCPKDEESRNDEGWSSCYKCNNLAKPQEGRLHMHCRCGAQYCVICGSKWKSCDCQWFGDDVEPDLRETRLVRSPKNRRELENGYERDTPPSPGELRARRELPDIRPPPKSYEEEVMLQELQDRRDQARRNHYISDGEYDQVGGPGDLVPLRNAPAPSHYMQDPYRHALGAPEVSGPPPPPPPPPDGRSSLDRSPRTDYIRRSRRGQSIERRLVDRFSDTRQTPGSMSGMEPPKMSHHSSPLIPPPMSLHQNLKDGGYSGGRIILKEYDPNDHRRDDSSSHFSHSSQSKHSKSKRRARRRESATEELKDSVLAGLSGRGTGMGRVDVWRKYVEPGDFGGEIANGAFLPA